MNCGCGGECCKQIKGLGFLSIEPQDTGGGGDFWGFDDSYWQSGGDFWGFDNPYWQGDYGGDFWGFDSPYWQGGGGYTDGGSGGPSFVMGDPNFYNQFRQTNQGQSGGGFDWQSLLDWWTQLTGNLPGAIGDAGGGTSPQLPGYCPGGTYHPLDDPFACVPFPPNADAVTRQRQTNAGNAANAAARARQAQQQSQGCLPNTGLVKNAQGQCVCPPGYAPNAQLKKCVLVSSSPGATGGLAWWEWALIAGFVVVAVKR